jgi:hypothetical protein
MYVDEKKQVGKQTLSEYLNKYYFDKAKKLAKTCSHGTAESFIEQAVNALYDLNTALYNGFEVWAEMTKEPRSLDAGCHWYQIYYLSLQDGKPIKNHFWAPLLMNKSRDKYAQAYGFSSSVIGMPRLMEATDLIFCILKSCGGTYAQLS